MYLFYTCILRIIYQCTDAPVPLPPPSTDAYVTRAKRACSCAFDKNAEKTSSLPLRVPLSSASTRIIRTTDDDDVHNGHAEPAFDTSTCRCRNIVCTDNGAKKLSTYNDDN